MEARSLTASQKLRLLPRNFESMKDDPVRSAVGMVFRELGIKKLRLRRYAELRIGDLLKERGLLENRQDKSDSQGDTDPVALAAAIRAFIVGDSLVREHVKDLGRKRRDRRGIARLLKDAE
jgi:hypothetical protein